MFSCWVKLGILEYIGGTYCSTASWLWLGRGYSDPVIHVVVHSVPVMAI